jgi:hypothetical protein
MKINGKTIDSRVTDALKSELRQAGDTALLNFVASVPYLNIGFRKGKMPAAVASTRVCAKLDKPQELTIWFRRFLQDLGLVRRIISVLSFEAIKSSALNLCQGLGAANVYAGALVDDRKEVVDWAIGEIDNWPDVQIAEIEIAQAKRELVIHFGAFALILNDEKAVRSVNESFAPSPVEMVSNRSEKNKRQVLELRRARQEVSQLKNAVKKLERDLLLAKLELKSSQQALVETHVELEQTRTVLTELTQAFETRVDAEVQIRIDARTLPWLSQAEALAKLSIDSAASDLLARAEEALARQALIDRRYGTWQALEKQRTAHKEMLCRLRDAELQAIRPLPELVELSRVIEQQIAVLDSQLGTGPVLNPSIQSTALLRNLRQCTTLEDLSGFRTTLQSVSALGLFSPSEERESYRVLHDVASRLYLSSCQGEGWKNALGHLKKLPLNELQIRLNANEECVLVVDGHNTLFQLESIFGSSFENGAPGGKSRRLLGERLLALSALHPSLLVELWFDGNEPSDIAIGDRVTVHYSGGKGPDRADKRIIEYFKFLSIKKPHICSVLVTADQSESAQAQENGAKVIAPYELGLLGIGGPDSNAG